ncbi:uncharacterized protein LOC110246525 [Exaiptasia diaphana]|uniref:RWD domain-containing protein n=1 Tax=Exaiptasia diaphana TaxID=2652724 RepID=A0A913XSH9_EXADI|nr:uncharacterized protein LOC110246525 [Exaiptasia diaphana]
MPWSVSQRKRLDVVEKGILESYFGDKITWNDPQGKTTVELKISTNSDNHYTLRIYLPSDYPNSCPELTVASPKELKRKDGTPMNGFASDADHTYGTKDGLIKICHFHQGKWTNEYTLYQVFMKGLLWLEAYESHRQTGKPISTYLREI